MEVVLEQINKIQGVYGSLLCDVDGKLLCRALPTAYDNKKFQDAADLIADSLVGINEATGGVSLLDLRFSNNRIIVKPLQGGFLLLICEQKLNLQLFNMSLSVAQKKLEKSILSARDSPVPVQPTAPLPVAPQVSTTQELRRDGKGVILIVDSMTASSKIQWDQMKEEAAISELLAQYLTKLSIPAPIKKLKITNKVTNKSKIFSIRLSRSEPGQLLDDKIALTLAASEALEARPGDLLTVESATSGMFTKDISFAGL